MTTTQQPPTAPQTVLASTVLTVVMRVAGPVPIEVRPYALGHPEQQVTARIGDAVVYLTDRAVAARIRQQWDAAQYLAATRLPHRASQTWLAPSPDSYPVGVALRLTGAVEVATQWISGHPDTRTPPHLRVRVDRLIWQLCDQQSWLRIGQAWFDAQRYFNAR
ncbi:MAG: hypothetical protein M3Y73_01560 [Actinomycetota bacterium]|nr:hypothetical protein [Actinomycetota bacterium]